MRIVVALGGNALLRRGEAPTIETQRCNAGLAAAALAPLARRHGLVLTHGNGPQVGLLAQQAAGPTGTAYPLDVLDAESEGMIGYLLEQELQNRLGAARACVTLLTRIEVAADDPAFAHPTKPISAFVDEAAAAALARARGWRFAEIDGRWRRVVPSPRPRRILQAETIALLVRHGVLAICAGGGGIPVVCDAEAGGHRGVEAVIDKDHASGLLARALGADALLLLTDVDAVRRDWGDPASPRFQRVSPDAIRAFRFAEGSMGPKVEAAAEFAAATGRPAFIGTLADAAAVLEGRAGTAIDPRAGAPEWWK